MKKYILTLSLITILFGCTRDIDFIGPEIDTIDIPNNLTISQLTGIRLENTIVQDEVNMNVKLPHSGTYRIKIRDISGKLISQEKIEGREGDNLLKVYVSALPKSSYTLLLTDYNHTVIGITSVVVE